MPGELNVKALPDEDTLVRLVSDEDPVVRALPRTRHQLVPGRLRLGEAVATAVRTRATADAGTVLRSLEPLAVRVARGPSIEGCALNAGLSRRLGGSGTRRYRTEDMMDTHADVADLLGAWALDACDPDEAAVVEVHLIDCARCAAEARSLRSAASWLGVEQVGPAPAGRRATVLAAARVRRPPALLRTLTEAYAEQVAQLDRVLDTFTPEDWRRADPRHDDVTGVIRHLAANDAMLAEDLGLRVEAPAGTGPAVRVGWHAQSEVLVRELSVGIALDQRVRLAGGGEPQWRPLREALVQRVFETWIHRDDVGAVVGRPSEPPPPAQVARIVDLAVGLLPIALRTNRMSCPGRGELVLSGPGGGGWTFPLGRPDEGTVVVTISAEAVDFARLVANRRSPDMFRHVAAGDRALAARILQVAATLGCD